MAPSRTTPLVEPWSTPYWPATPPDPTRAVVAYGEHADELVVGFGGRPTGVVVPLAAPVSDVAVLVDIETGEIVSAQVDNLRFKAAERQRGWLPLTDPDPPPATVVAFIAAVADLYARHGTAD